MRYPGILLETERDHDWLDEAIAWQWELPPVAGWFWRLYGIRHIRSALWVAGAYILLVPCKPDWHALWRREWTAYAIRRGWC